MKNEITPACELPWRDKVWMKKDAFGWRVVHPMRDEKGKIIWINFLFGGKRNALFLFIVLLIFGAYVLGTYELFNSMRVIAENPCDYCNPIVEFDGSLFNALG